MSYSSVAAIRQDPWLRDRVAACAAVEGEPRPEEWVQTHAWPIAVQPGWAAAWDSALAAHTDAGYLPGSDEAVISDPMILSAVQGLRGADND